jgi:predicted negative regulator of RcsB-dependent stress response
MEKLRTRLDDTKSAPPAALLSLTRTFIELGLYTQALENLQTVLATDDEEVEAWYLQGWCFVLMAEQARETGEKVEELGWQELAQDARDCLESCQMVNAIVSL